MNPSNCHPCNAARGPWRAFLLRAACGLLTALLVAPAPALAQGLIQFSVGSSTFTRYQVGDDGTGRRTLPFPQTSQNKINATTRSDYWNGPQYVGRQYLYVGGDGSNTSSGVLMAWSEGTGQSKALTNFPSPYTVYLNLSLWSNDGLDSFVSFTLINTTTNQSYIYRAWVSAADIASATYQPITLGDPRLTLVGNWGAPAFYWWGHDGSRFYYKDPRNGNGNLIRVKTVGVGATIDDDPIVFTAPFELSEHRVIPAVDPQNPVNDRYLVASALPAGTGIVAIDLQSSAWWWLAPQTSSSLSGIRGPCFSPDGSSIAFAATRSVTTTKPKTTTTYYGVYTVPFFGGPIPRVTEVTGSGYPTVNNWNTP
jgi:hypothetical protein